MLQGKLQIMYFRRGKVSVKCCISLQMPARRSH